MLLATLGWGGWREYDFRCAVREARAAAPDFRMDESPLGQIRGDWHAAFDKDTWTDRERRLIVPDSRDLAPLRPLLHRLGPTVLQVSDGQHLEALQGLTELKRIFLPECAALQNVDGLRGLAGLKQLDLERCTALQNVDALRGHTGLQRLYLGGCHALQSVDGLRSLTGLQRLWLKGCNNIPVSALRELRAALPKADIIFPDGTATTP